MWTRLLYNQYAETAHVHRAPCKLSCNNCTVSDLEQTAPVGVSPPAVWPLSVKQGPTRWASRSLNPPSLPDSSAGQASECPALHRSPRPLQCLAWKTQKYLPCTHQACFSMPGLTLVRKPPLPFPVCNAQSAEANLWQEDTSPNRQMSRQFWQVCHECFFGSCFRFLWYRQWLPNPVHIYNPHISLRSTKFCIPARTRFLHWPICNIQILVLTYFSYCVLHQLCGRIKWTPPLWRHARWRRTWDHGQVRHCNALLSNYLLCHRLLPNDAFCCSFEPFIKLFLT